jgi:hypothetical protein
MADDLTTMEGEIEIVRARLAGRLARLRQPETLEAAKHDALAQANGYKAEAAARIKRAAVDKAQDFLHAARLRAERNPAAAAAVVAGAVCRATKSKSIGSMIIVAGLSSLARTSTNGLGSQTPTTDAVLGARDAALANVRRASAAVEDAGRNIQTTALSTSDRAAVAVHDAGEQLSAAAAQAGTQATRLVAEASERTARARSLAAESFRSEPLTWGALALVVGFGASWLSRRRS